MLKTMPNFALFDLCEN